MNSTLLKMEKINHWFDGEGGNRNLVIHDVNFEMQQGQFVSLVGSSGCGKSTFLKMILGTHPPRQGTVLLNGREILKPCRDVGIVYQKYS
ncbi:MAG: ATP-binding cassette domain-containing protein, partial [Candidatus Wallbacteria bacterium]|nr:ATP-binding cassette domain-containing protein [Candidatus Wallbacteria bacterium]